MDTPPATYWPFRSTSLSLSVYLSFFTGLYFISVVGFPFHPLCAHPTHRRKSTLGILVVFPNSFSGSLADKKTVAAARSVCMDRVQCMLLYLGSADQKIFFSPNSCKPGVIRANVIVFSFSQFNSNPIQEAYMSCAVCFLCESGD